MIPIKTDQKNKAFDYENIVVFGESDDVENAVDKDSIILNDVAIDCHEIFVNQLNRQGCLSIIISLWPN